MGRLITKSAPRILLSFSGFLNPSSHSATINRAMPYFAVRLRLLTALPRRKDIRISEGEAGTAIKKSSALWQKKRRKTALNGSTGISEAMERAAEISQGGRDEEEGSGLFSEQGTVLAAI